MMKRSGKKALRFWAALLNLGAAVCWLCSVAAGIGAAVCAALAGAESEKDGKEQQE